MFHPKTFPRFGSAKPETLSFLETRRASGLQSGSEEMGEARGVDDVLDPLVVCKVCRKRYKDVKDSSQKTSVCLGRNFFFSRHLLPLEISTPAPAC